MIQAACVTGDEYAETAAFLWVPLGHAEITPMNFASFDEVSNAQ